MTVPALELSSGDKLPAIGLGMWKVDGKDCPSLIRAAIESGYRHFDLACDYGNEAEVGEGFRQVLEEGLVKREDLWITSKLWNTYHRTEHVRPALQKTLDDLQLTYLDLYLIHFPIAQAFVPFERRYPPGWFFDPGDEEPKISLEAVPIEETWRAMEQLVHSQLVRNIGVCNFGTALLRDLLSYAKVRPTVLQVESHPYLTQEKLLRYCREQQIIFTAFSPLGALSYLSLGMAEAHESVLEQPAIVDAAAAHGKTPAQVVLRWGLQRGTAIVPKTSNPERLHENFDLDFELSGTEMAAISALNQNRRFNDPGEFCEKAFNTFCPIYE